MSVCRSCKWFIPEPNNRAYCLIQNITIIEREHFCTQYTPWKYYNDKGKLMDRK